MGLIDQNLVLDVDLAADKEFKYYIWLMLFQFLTGVRHGQQ